MTEAPAPSNSAAKHPPRRIRNYLLDPSFQLKYTGILVGSSLILLVSLGAVIKQTTDLATRQAAEAADLADIAEDQAERAFRESQASARILRMNQLAQADANPELARAIEAELEQVDANARAELARIQAQRAAVRRQRARIHQTRSRTLDLLAGSGLLFVVTLGLLGIVITHRIVGPAYRMKHLLWRVGSGRLDIRDRLRQGDELKDLFDAFTAMVSSLRGEQAREIAELEAAIDAAATAGLSERDLKGLRSLRDRMRAVLG